MDAQGIISSFENKKFKPVYWLEGEESYFIDKVVDFAENHILSEAESSFNKTVFYGRDTNWADIVTTCRRYPMFSEIQLVIIKEAQYLKDIENLESYIANPLASTILVVAYKDKKVDGRKTFGKTIKQNGVLLTTKKFYDNEIPGWVSNLVKAKGFVISEKALYLLIEHIGNDLSRIENEINKLAINIINKQITEDDIENYIGVSKDYNVFELQNALSNKNFEKALSIIQYFANNPKSAPLPLLFGNLYAYFSKVYMVFGTNGHPDEVAIKLGIKPFFAKDYLSAAKKYGKDGIEKILLLLHQYNLKSIGIGNKNDDIGVLLKELLVKIML